MKKLITIAFLMALASVSYGQAKSALDEIISIMMENDLKIEMKNK